VTPHRDQESTGQRNLAELGRGLRSRVVALDEPVTRADWAAVVRRSRILRLGFFGAASVLTAALVAGVVFLAGWQHGFGSRGSSPIRPVGLEISPPGLNADPVAMSEAVLRTSVRLGDRLHTLVLSKIRDGSFCYRLAGAGQGCDQPASLEVSWKPGRVVGSVSSQYASGVVIRFTNGTSVRPGISWLTGPVRAGFFFYPIPRGRVISSVVATDTLRTTRTVLPALP
jgi:hypothetical protein